MTTPEIKEVFEDKKELFEKATTELEAIKQYILNPKSPLTANQRKRASIYLNGLLIMIYGAEESKGSTLGTQPQK